MALWMVIIGTASKQKDEHQVAVEALIAVIEDCRLNGKRWGSAMREMLEANAVRVNSGWGAEQVSPLISITRWSKAMKPIMQASMYHAYVVSDALQELLQGDSTAAPKDIGMLFEILLDAMQQTGDEVTSEATKKYLTDYMTLHPTTKSGKLCKQLLALKRKPNYSANLSQIKNFALDRKYDRALRWAKSVHI